MSRTRTYDRSVNSRLLYRLSYQGIRSRTKRPAINRQLPNLPGRLQPSTFGVWVLNFCVRDGNRWATQPSPPDQLAQIPIVFVVGARRSLRLRLRAFRLAQKNLYCAVFVKDCSLKTKQEKKYLGHFNKKSGPRRISAGLLHALRRSHSLPINLVFYKAPYYLAIWEASSQGGLHA